MSRPLPDFRDLSPSPPGLPHRDQTVAGHGARRENGVCRLATAIAAAGAGLGVERIVGRQRSTARVALARQLAMYLAHVGLGLPQSGVAEAFGRDRSTVAHACRRIEDLRDDPAFDRQVAQMEASLRWAAER